MTQHINGSPSASSGGWSKPVIEDFGVEDTEHHVGFPGLDNYEASNPVNYGVTS